jgi:hemoglobin
MAVRKLIPLCDKIGRARIEEQIHRFYEKLQQDPEMKGFFEHIPDFSAHEQRIADFWWTAMGGRLDHDPGIDMVGKHMPLGIKDEHIQRWLATFKETLYEVMEPELADQWYMMAEGIAMRLRQIVVAGEMPGMPQRPSEPRS